MKKTVKGLFYVALAATIVMGADRVALAQGATITGKIVFEGTPPVQQPINFGAEKQCAMMHGDKIPQNEEVVVNPNGTLRSVLIYIKEGVSAPSAPPAEPVRIDQKGCVFSPHVSVAMAGQKIIFKNSDAILHNVRIVAKNNKSFNIAQPIQGMETGKTLDKPEIGIQVRCDVHFWMVSYLHILDNPYFAVTGEEGTYTIKDLPAGNYTLEVWQEKLGVQTAQITVADGESKISDFTYKAA